MNNSVAETLMKLSPAEREAALSCLTPEELEAFQYDWKVWGRKNQQLPGGDWFVWLVSSGRGFGKTRTGGEACRTWTEEAEKKGTTIRIACVAETAADARDVMVEGESGLISITPPWWEADYEPSKRRFSWYHKKTGRLLAEMGLFSGKEPDQLRGPQHHKAWVDEWCKFQYPKETWDNMELGLRLGDKPQVVVTTTPRPLAEFIALVKDEMTYITTGSSYENVSNLAPTFIKRVIKKYDGTRLGAQEIHAQILLDLENALWKHEYFENNRVKSLPDMASMVVALDPSVTSTENSDECGIIVAGRGVDGLGYVLFDHSDVLSPMGWAKKAVSLYNSNHADYIVAEKNNGGDLVETTLRTVDDDIPFRDVWASRGKVIRAQPIASLCEQNKIKFAGVFPKMEDQLCCFTDRGYEGGDSPDRAEAMIWAMYKLMLGPGGEYDPDLWLTFRK